MKSEELNIFIKHYIEEDKTQRAIMITGDWGTGKSYYIKNELKPFLSKSENGAYDCIIVSLYGTKDIHEVSKNLYWEIRSFKKFESNEKTEAGKIIAKTMMKSIFSYLGIDITQNDKDLDSFYQAINLSEKIIVFEDLERTNINLSEFMGYINNLVEQDGAKVLLVANEREMLHYDSDNDEMKKDTKKRFTTETIQYLSMKEKTIGDTIIFEGDIQKAIKHIFLSFDSSLLNTFMCDIPEIYGLMIEHNNYNLRSIIFACQKTIDLFNQCKEEYSIEFLKCIFFGNICFSLKIKSGQYLEWKGGTNYSTELGNSLYPMFKISYEYFIHQIINANEFKLAYKAYKDFRLYDRTNSICEKDIIILDNCYKYTEEKVLIAIDNITDKLKKNDISLYKYGHLATAFMVVKKILDVDISEVKKYLVDNLKESWEKVDSDFLYIMSFHDEDKNLVDEYNELKQKMINSINRREKELEWFNYQPEQIISLCQYFKNNIKKMKEKNGFASYLEPERFGKMFVKCDSSQMYVIRDIFNKVYTNRVYYSDKIFLESLLTVIKDNERLVKMDRIQSFNCKNFILELEQYYKWEDNIDYDEENDYLGDWMNDPDNIAILQNRKLKNI